MTDPFDDGSNTATAEPDSDFFSGGSPSCRFEKVGAMHHGVIVNFSEAQQRDIKTKAPAVWPDGNPKMMLVVTLQTEERDDEIDDDDGERRLFVNKPSGMFAAIKSAIGKNKFAVGGHLAIKYVGDGKKKEAAFNAPKLYDAKYTPPGGTQTATAPVSAAMPTNGTPVKLSAKAEAYKCFMEKWTAFASERPSEQGADKAKGAWLAVLAEVFGADTNPQTATDGMWQDALRQIRDDYIPGLGICPV